MKSDIVENKLSLLPDHSRYKSLEPITLAKRREVSQGGAISAEEYAKNMVWEALKPSLWAWIWKDSKAWIVWAVDTFLPRIVFVSDREPYVFSH